jgi:hypothetical protein
MEEEEYNLKKKLEFLFQKLLIVQTKFVDTLPKIP